MPIDPGGPGDGPNVHRSITTWEPNLLLGSQPFCPPPPPPTHSSALSPVVPVHPIPHPKPYLFTALFSPYPPPPIPSLSFHFPLICFSQSFIFQFLPISLAFLLFLIPLPSSLLLPSDPNPIVSLSNHTLNKS